MQIRKEIVEIKRCLHFILVSRCWVLNSGSCPYYIKALPPNHISCPKWMLLITRVSWPGMVTMSRGDIMNTRAVWATEWDTVEKKFSISISISLSLSLSISISISIYLCVYISQYHIFYIICIWIWIHFLKDKVTSLVMKLLWEYELRFFCLQSEFLPQQELLCYRHCDIIEYTKQERVKELSLEVELGLSVISSSSSSVELSGYKA